MVSVGKPQQRQLATSILATRIGEYEKDEHQGYDTNTSAVWNTSDDNSYIMEGGVTTRLPWNTILDVNIYRNLREAEFTAKSNSYFSTGGSFLQFLASL